MANSPGGAYPWTALHNRWRRPRAFNTRPPDRTNSTALCSEHTRSVQCGTNREPAIPNNGQILVNRNRLGRQPRSAIGDRPVGSLGTALVPNRHSSRRRTTMRNSTNMRQHGRTGSSTPLMSAERRHRAGTHRTNYPARTGRGARDLRTTIHRRVQPRLSYMASSASRTSHPPCCHFGATLWLDGCQRRRRRVHSAFQAHDSGAFSVMFEISCAPVREAAQEGRPCRRRHVPASGLATRRDGRRGCTSNGYGHRSAATVRYPGSQQHRRLDRPGRPGCPVRADI